MISYCDDCGEYLGDYVDGILFKFGQRVTEPHLCPGMDYHRKEGAGEASPNGEPLSSPQQAEGYPAEE